MSAPEAVLQALSVISYAHGYQVGQQFATRGEWIAADVACGIVDALEGRAGKISEPEIEAAIAVLRAEGEKARAEAQARGAAEKPAAKARIDAVLAGALESTASGLRFVVNKAGQGRKPKASSQVRVHYTGYLLDGTKFDSSVDRGQPAEFPLDGVIRGWTEGLQLMAEGASFTFVIPAELAYGERGAGEDIPPGATLLFDVELIKVLG